MRRRHGRPLAPSAVQAVSAHHPEKVFEDTSADAAGDRLCVLHVEVFVVEAEGVGGVFDEPSDACDWFQLVVAERGAGLCFFLRDEEFGIVIPGFGVTDLSWHYGMLHMSSHLSDRHPGAADVE